MNKCVLLLTLIFINVQLTLSQNQFWGVTSKGGTSNAGTLFKTNMQGLNHSIQFNAELLNHAYLPSEFTGMVEHPESKEIFLVTEEGGTAGLGGLFKYNPGTTEFTKLIDFDGANGKRPHGGLLFVNNKIYGTTKDSNADSDFPNGTGGSIFEFDTQTGNLISLHKFNDTNGKSPYSALYKASNGKLYGTTSGGGANSKGVLFEYDIDNKKYTLLHSFSIGKAPYGGVVEVSNKLYGSTSQGGSSDKGIIFEFDLSTKTYNVMVHFTSSHSGYMKGSFVDINNELYGVTNGNQQVTGAYGKLIKYVPGETSCSILHSFMIFTSGIYPIGGLCKEGNTLIGSLEGGPFTPRGTIFEYNLDAASGSEFTYTALSSVAQIDLKGSLLSSANGIFGLTKSSGITNNGSIYKYDRASSPKNITDVVSFKIDIAGSNPVGKITRAADGKLYGNMQSGGKNRSGVLFSYNPLTDQYAIEHDFSKDSKPNGSMALVGNQRLYGMSETGGDYNQGYIFEYNTNTDNFNIIHHFNTYLSDNQTFNDANLGAFPKAGFTILNDSILYGTTSKGGFADEGMLFKIIASKHETIEVIKLVSFDELTGSEPAGDLVQIGDFLYGMTYNGGTLVPGGGQGTIFQYKINGNYEPLVAFQGTNNGSYPMGSFTSHNDKLYAFTHGERYNAAQLGVLFEYDPANKYTHTVLHEFIGSSSQATSVGGSKPYGKMTLSTNGKLYGTTSMGSGMSATGGDYGVLFEFDPVSQKYKSIETFTGANGATPSFNSELVIICAADASATVDQAKENIIANESNANSYQWYSVNVNSDLRTLISGATDREFYPSESGTYCVEVEKDGCANYSDYYYVEVSECVINVGVDYDTDNMVLTASEASADTYQWQLSTETDGPATPIDNATERAFAPSETGYYAVKITKGNCNDTSTPIYHEQPVICNIDTTLNFDADLLLLTANESNANYQWYEKTDLGILTVIDAEKQRIYTPDHTGTFLVEITIGECSAFSESFEYVHDITCGTNASVSYDYVLKLFVANEANATAYQWYAVNGTPEALTILDGETKRTFVPSKSGNYKAEVSKNGCSNFSETYSFEVDAECNTNATANYNTDLNIFIASEANATKYQWYEIINESLIAIDGESGRAYTPNHTGEYVVEVTKNECSNYSDPMQYEHVSVCTTDASASFNEGLKIFIANEPGAEKYQWFEVDNHGGLLIIVNATHRTYTPLKSATYQVKVTKNGCSNFSDALEYDLSANCQTDASVIYKEELQLYIASEPNAILYQWYEETAEGLVALNGENGRSFSPVKTGYYVLEVSNNGCSNLSETLYFEQSNECSTVAAIYYRGSNHSLEATETNAENYAWFMENTSGVFEPIPGATDRIYFPMQSGNYKVSVLKGGCEKLSESLEYVHYIECSLVAGATINESGTQIDASENNATHYQWYEWLELDKQLILLENETTKTITPIKSGNYLVEIRVDDCSDFSSPVYFEFTDPCAFEPVATLNEQTQTISVQELENVKTYEWYVTSSSNELQKIEGENSTQLMPATTGTYVAKVTLENNCSQYSNEISFTEPFICDISVTIYYDVHLHAFTTNFTNAETYQWYKVDYLNSDNLQPVDGANNSIFSPAESGFYVLEVSVHETCSAISQTLKYQKPGEGCDVYAFLTFDTEMKMLVANDMGKVTYEWLLKDDISKSLTLISSTSEPSYTPEETGIYVVKIDDGTCSETSNEVYFETSTSISAIAANNRSQVYPNPATEHITIEAVSAFDHVDIVSLSGKTMQQQGVNNVFKHVINIHELENGIYFLRLTHTNGVRETVRFVKQNR